MPSAIRTMSALVFLVGSVSSVLAQDPKAADHVVKRPAFDLKYYSDTASPGMVSFRPVAMMKMLPVELTSSAPEGLIRIWCQIMGGKATAAKPPTFEQVEECTVGMSLHFEVESNGTLKPFFRTSSYLLKTVDPFPWQESVKKWFPHLESVEYAQGRYHRLVVQQATGSLRLAFWIPDARTIVSDTEDNIRQAMTRVQEGKWFPRQEPWEDVHNDLIALWINGQKVFQGPPEQQDVKTAGESFVLFTMGIEADATRTRLRINALGTDEKACAKGVVAVSKLFQASRNAYQFKGAGLKNAEVAWTQLIDSARSEPIGKRSRIITAEAEGNILTFLTDPYRMKD